MHYLVSRKRLAAVTAQESQHLVMAKQCSCKKTKKNLRTNFPQRPQRIFWELKMLCLNPYQFSSFSQTRFFKSGSHSCSNVGKKQSLVIAIEIYMSKMNYPARTCDGTKKSYSIGLEYLISKCYNVYCK